MSQLDDDFEPQSILGMAAEVVRDIPRWEVQCAFFLYDAYQIMTDEE